LGGATRLAISVYEYTPNWSEGLGFPAPSSRLADKYVGKDGGPPLPDIEKSLHELGEMSPAEYGRRREELQTRLAVRAATLISNTKSAARPRSMIAAALASSFLTQILGLMQLKEVTF
jgi:hypothetical protein